MTDADDFALRALFHDGEDREIAASHEAFTQSVMARVNAHQLRRKMMFDGVWLAIIASCIVIALVALPIALPAIQASFTSIMASNALNFRLSGESLTLLAFLVLGSLGWRLAIKN